ncbi:sialate O-acetylesterase [Patella vulgata]|uniref:sialate O-acetylesterase n=1 Tax=Patella vulgata TaxID=6465 RepID=UPI0024A81152|nr:sialate O-acetylesterase [Patella vulgata]
MLVFTACCFEIGPRAASVLWNSMVIPLLPQTIYGAIWYQGESNTHNSDQYACLFPSMIKDWRLKFHQASMGATNQNFPFGFVQLAGNQNDSNRIAGFPAIRWSQTAKYGYAPNPKMPYTFMAVAMDLPDFKSPHGTVHPRYKQDVAERLGLAGLAVAYGEKGLSYQGPYPTSFNTKTKDQLVIEYNHGSSVLDVRSNNGFENN